MTETMLNIPRGQSVPYLDQWLGQWFIEPERGAALFGAMRQLNIGVHLQQRDTARQDSGPAIPVDYVQPPRSYSAYGYRVIDGVALLELNGSLMKHEASATESTSTIMMRRTIRTLMSDGKVKAVIVLIDSPGGTVSGAYELAADIAALAKVKPVYAFGTNVMASAAYLMASQMTGISAAPSTLVGSLGTFGAVYDSTGAAAMMGYKVHLLKGRVNGKVPLMKGAGAPGTDITPDQLERMQESVDDMNQQFIDAVLSGPRSPKEADVEAWFLDAGVWMSPKAMSMGLIDHVESFDELFSRVAKQNESGGAANVPSTSDKPTDDDTSIRRRSHSIELAVGEQKMVFSAPTAAEAVALHSAFTNTTTPLSASEPESKEMAESNKGAATDTKAGQSQELPKASEGGAAANIAVAELKTFTPAAATAVEIDQACPGASSDFKLECLRSGQHLAQVKDSFIGWQSGQIRTRDEEIVKAKAENDTLKASNATLEAKVKANGGLIASTAAEGQVKDTGAKVDGKSKAEAEWESNFEGCQQAFSSKESYVAIRKREIDGTVKSRKSA